MRIQPSLSGDQDAVVCPFCGDEHVHLVQVNVYPVAGKIECEIKADDIRTYPSEATKTQRGSSVVIKFICESGHLWKTEFRFHKGEILINEELIAEPGPRLTRDAIWKKVKAMWRD